MRLIWCPAQGELATGGLSGVDTLSRWSSNRLGGVSPGILIEAAERSDLSVPLTLWSLNAPLCKATSWQHNAPLTNVAISPSQRVFTEPEPPALIAQALQIWELESS